MAQQRSEITSTTHGSDSSSTFEMFLLQYIGLKIPQQAPLVYSNFSYSNTSSVTDASANREIEIIIREAGCRTTYLAWKSILDFRYFDTMNIRFTSCTVSSRASSGEQKYIEAVKYCTNADEYIS